MQNIHVCMCDYVPGRSTLASTITYKHCLGWTCSSREIACNEIKGYSSENPCSVSLFTQESTLQLRTT